MNFEGEWTVYRTRFLVRARQLTAKLIFVDTWGREQSGAPGDYLVESSDGVTRITAQALFEDIYVPLLPRLFLPAEGNATAEDGPCDRAEAPLKFVKDLSLSLPQVEMWKNGKNEPRKSRIQKCS